MISKGPQGLWGALELLGHPCPHSEISPKWYHNDTQIDLKYTSWENIQNMNVVGVGVPACSLCSCLLFAACWVSRSVELSVYAFPSYGLCPSHSLKDCWLLALLVLGCLGVLGLWVLRLGLFVVIGLLGPHVLRFLGVWLAVQ